MFLLHLTGCNVNIQEFQEESIQLALRSKSIDQTARDLCIPISTLHGWIHRLSKKQHPADIQDAKALHEELKQLRKELARAKEERDIFKKATSYFAKVSK